MSTPGYIAGHPPAPTGMSSGKVTITSGAPTEAPTSGIGWAYDPSTGTAYLWNPSTEAWDEASSGGGGGDSQRFFSGAGSPEGVVTATVVPALYWDTTNTTFWLKTSGAGTNTGWGT